MDVSKVVLLSSQYPEAHGGPVHVGDPAVIGIKDISQPDWGAPVPILPGEVMVFHACGVTTQQVLVESGVDFAITHYPGCMFVTDTPI